MKDNFNDLVNSFAEYLAYELNYSKKTIKTYNTSLKKYKLYLESIHIPYNYVTSSIASAYKAFLISKNLEPKTSSLNLTAVRSFYNYLVEIKVIGTNPFASLKNPKVAKKLPNFLNSSDTTLLFSDINYENELEVRNAFIIEFLYVTGLRVSELCSLKVSDLNNDGTIKVLGKGSKERIVFYKACDAKLLNHYLDYSRPHILNGLKSEYLLISKSGKALTTRSVEAIVKKYCTKKNIKSKVTPHTLRHTYATDLLNNDADIRSVGELLGHESLSTTQIYTHVTSERLKKIYNNTHPRQKK